MSRDEFPDDVVLLELNGEQMGRSPTHPNVIFGIDEWGPYSFVATRDRNSLLDLLSVFLGKLIVRSSADNNTYPVVENQDYFHVATEMEMRASRPKDDDSIGRSGVENSEAIAHRLEELIQFNECNDIFVFGKDSGRLVAICEDCAERVTKATMSEVEQSAIEREVPTMPGEDLAPDGDPFRDMSEIEVSGRQSALDWIVYRGQLELYRSTLERLVANPLVKRSAYAGLCLEGCSLPKIVWCPEQVGFEMRRRDAIQHASRIRMRIWLALGEVLGFLRDADNVARAAEWASAAPRTFRELFDASGDKVRNAIRDAERALSVETGGEDVAARVIGMLVHGIEALAKRTWPIPCSGSQQSQNTLVQELMSKRQSGREHEQRFADIAITLYKRYRNPFVHEFEKFRCSFNEARFFVSGMRTLLELSDRIIASRKRG
jgi:hypothetical protein